MPLKLSYVTPNTGAPASYHVVQQVGLDYVSTLMSATVASYLDSDAKDAGKFPMYTQQIQIVGLPESGVDAKSFAESALAAPVPQDDGGLSNTNRYAFAGAEIVA
jgi:hypothetical protein